MLEIVETRDHLSGIIVFINGLGQSRYDVSGYDTTWGLGFLMTQSAIGQIIKYLKKEDRAKDVAIFDEFYRWFERIYTAQVVLGFALMAIPVWNESMAAGFYNILTKSQISYQSRLLDCQYKVIEDPVVKSNIFEKYLSVLNEIINDSVDAELKEDVQKLIDIVERKALGED